MSSSSQVGRAAGGGGGGGGRYNFEALLRLDLRCRDLKLRRGVPLVGPEVARLWDQQRVVQGRVNEWTRLAPDSPTRTKWVEYRDALREQEMRMLDVWIADIQRSRRALYLEQERRDLDRRIRALWRYVATGRGRQNFM